MASDATKISKQSSYSSRMNLNSNSLSLFSQKQVNQFDHISVESKSSSGISSCVNQNQHYLGSAYRSCKQEKNYNLLIQSAFFKNTCREVTFLILLLTVVVFGIVVALLLLLLKNSLKRYRKLLIKDKTITIETRSTYKFEKMDNKFPHLTDGGHVHGIQRSYLTVDEKESSIEHEKPSTYYLKDIKRTSSADAIHNSSSFEKLHRQYRICDKKQFNLSVADTTSSSLTHPNSTLPSANELCYNDQFFSHEPHKYGAIKRYRESNVDPICKITFGQGSANSIQPSQNENLSKPEISEIFTLESSSIIRNTCLLQRKPFNDKNVENVRNELPASNDKKKKSAFDRDRRHINLSTNDENRSQVNDDCFRTVLSQSFIVFANEENSRNIHDISSNLTKNLAIASVKTALTPNVTNAFGVPREFILLPKPVQHDESSQLYRINDNSKIENSYFRFPEVDIFTPPIKEQVVNQNSIEKENEVEITSNIIMSISPEESSINPLALLPYPTIDVYDRSAKLVHNSYDRSTLTETKKDSNITTPTPSTNNAFFTNRVDRRSRLKSISLDSEGARLVEENFTKSIPVEELVEIVANQSHSSQNESQVQLKILGTRDDNDQVLGKKRNIFNLTLDLNDRDDTLITDNDCKLNEFYVEYYDYDDDDEDDNDNDDEIEKYDGQSQTTTKVYTDRRIKQHFELQTSKIPPLKHTRQKACSLDSARSVSYVQPQDITYKFPDKEEHKTARALNSRTSLTRTFSLSVPTTPKRQFYRLHQHSGKFKSNLFNNDDGSLNINNSPAAEKYLFCGFQQQIKSSEEIFDVFSNSVDIGHKTSSTKTLSSDISQRREQDLSNVNLKTLPEICPVRSFADSNTLEKPYLQALSKSRSSILQRRGSNHSLTLNLDIIAVSDNLSKRLSASNYSLGNYKGSRLSLVGSSFNLQQQPQQMHGSNLSSVQTSQSKKNLLQRRGSNTSLILNLKGSSSSLNHYTSQGSLNIQNQQNFRPAKKGLLERRNSNSNLALFNVQNRELSKSNSNLPGSICSLNSISTYHSKNGQLMLEATEHHENINCEHWSLANTLNESHLTPKCQQYGGRRKFLSTDGLNDITDSRAGYCCQQRETNANNLQIFHKEPTDNCCGSAENVKKHYAFHKIDCACMAGKATVSDKVNVPCKNNFKFKSTVVSTASANNLTQFTCCNYCCCSCVDSLVEAVNTMSISNTNNQ
ncbi:uncharacterized protein LOC128738986 isoform X2 [Sabethes cyaneus]|uniref:uncharacterized protein LOC128738986 isoform X2 n=1 Tax=Sabethes cyaneus TaxID=53552 RepID=UPI00237D878C|nr:uncharacterized protein LOC128738986 isoform X2 [Sabethes cyaneus]